MTSCPKYPQSNGSAERTVQTMKNLLTKAEDPHEALLAYRATPLENGSSPAELCMGRRLRTTLPTVPSKLIPQWPELAKLRETEEKMKSKQVLQYYQRHAAKELSNVLPGDRVYVPDRRENAVVVSKTPEPRSYLIETDINAAVRRNRGQLTPNPKDTVVPSRDVPKIPTVNPPGQAPSEVEKARESVPKPNSEVPVTSTRSGRRVIPPKRLGFNLKKKKTPLGH